MTEGFGDRPVRPAVTPMGGFSASGGVPSSLGGIGSAPGVCSQAATRPRRARFPRNIRRIAGIARPATGAARSAGRRIVLGQRQRRTARGLPPSVCEIEAVSEGRAPRARPKNDGSRLASAPVANHAGCPFVVVKALPWQGSIVSPCRPSPDASWDLAATPPTGGAIRPHPEGFRTRVGVIGRQSRTVWPLGAAGRHERHAAPDCPIAAGDAAVALIPPPRPRFGGWRG